MTRYIINRFIKSIISIFIVVCLVVGIVYKLVPSSKIFMMDEAYKKLKGNPKIVYQLNKMEYLGYLDFKPITEMCSYKEGKAGCTTKGSDEQKRVIDAMKKEGYKVAEMSQPGEGKGMIYAVKDYNVFQLVGRYFGRMLQIDSKNAIQDPKNKDLKRGYSLTQGPNGAPALKCSGCKYKYQLYFNTKFPFIHQNKFKLYFGESYPTSQGVHTMDVIGQGQGKAKMIDQTFPTGKQMKSPINQYMLQYKPDPSHLDEKRFDDHYAKAPNYAANPSMIQTSYLFGVVSLLITYLFAIPFAIAMARNKGKLIDKIGIVYINIMISVPSLAFIFFVKYIGVALGLPDKFPHFGFGNPRSYILPMIILGLLSTPGLMLWLRRYMVDQESADYVKFCKAKGLSRREISSRHIFKNAVIPIVNGIPSSIILAIGGAVLTETVFAIPGMGKMLPDAINASNNNMVITLTFIFSSLAIFSVFLGDILMTIVDPRISLNLKKGE